MWLELQVVTMSFAQGNEITSLLWTCRALERACRFSGLQSPIACPLDNRNPDAAEALVVVVGEVIRNSLEGLHFQSPKTAKMDPNHHPHFISHQELLDMTSGAAACLVIHFQCFAELSPHVQEMHGRQSWFFPSGAKYIGTVFPSLNENCAASGKMVPDSNPFF